MTARTRYSCPWCKTVSDGAGQFINHMFGYHRELIRERLAMTGYYGTHNPRDPPRTRAKRALRINRGVSGEGDSS